MMSARCVSFERQLDALREEVASERQVRHCCGKPGRAPQHVQVYGGTALDRRQSREC